VPMPEGAVVVTSAPLTDGELPGYTTVWVA